MIIGKIKSFLGALLILFLFAVILFPLHAIADSCPCCGQSYGAAAPGDEARVNALRATHEASCCASSGKSSGGSSGNYQQPGTDWGEIQRRQNQKAKEEENERIRLEQERQRKEAEEEAKRREEEAREKFKESQRQALELMKGTESDILTIKSGTAFFGKAGSPGTPEGIKIKSGMPEEALNQSVKTWACAGWIADFVFPAARKGDVSEIRFLEEQVAKSLSGEKPGVDCPKLPPPPDVQGVAIGPNSPGLKFYGTLIKAVSIQSEQIVKARDEIAQSLGKKHVSDEDIQKLEQELKAQEKAKPALAKKDEIENKKKNEKLKEEVKPEIKKVEDPSLAIARAALKKAQEAKKTIGEYESMHKKVQADPSLAEKLIGKIEK